MSEGRGGGEREKGGESRGLKERKDKREQEGRMEN